jgi:inhibitor of KinA sporulation pathway (predicted exonuclease)
MANEPIDDLKKRYETLRDKKVAAEANLKTSTEELERVKAEAREHHGTDDLAQLEKILEEMKQENQRKRTEYLAQLKEVEEKLAAVEKQFAETAK